MDGIYAKHDSGVGYATTCRRGASSVAAACRSFCPAPTRTASIRSSLSGAAMRPDKADHSDDFAALRDVP